MQLCPITIESNKQNFQVNFFLISNFFFPKQNDCSCLVTIPCFATQPSNTLSRVSETSDGQGWPQKGAELKTAHTAAERYGVFWSSKLRA